MLVLQQLLSPATASSAELKRMQLAEASAKVKRHDFDTGSTSVQLLRLCSRIKQLKDHLAVHKKDHVTARSLNAMVEQRRAQAVSAASAFVALSGTAPQSCTASQRCGDAPRGDCSRSNSRRSAERMRAVRMGGRVSCISSSRRF